VTSTFRDFDASSRKPLNFKMLGKPRTLPASPPAKRVTAFLRLQAGQTPNEQVQEALWNLFQGPADTKSLIEKLIEDEGADWDSVQALIQWAMHQWNLGPPPEDEQTTEYRIHVQVEALKETVEAAVVAGDDLDLLLRQLQAELTVALPELRVIPAAELPKDGLEREPEWTGMSGPMNPAVVRAGTPG
jgi:hypothetical protein